jgi:hypothetical protein
VPNGSETYSLSSVMSNGMPSPDDDEEIRRTVQAAQKIAEEAEWLLKAGKPFEYFVKAYSLDHEGDLTPARCMALVFAASSVANGDGLHCYLSGHSGRGKTHAAETMFRQLPEPFRYNKSFSDRYLFYAEIPAGSVIMVDDQTMSETVQEIFKVSVSHYRDGTDYGTVVNQKPHNLKMPPRLSWVLLKVDDPGDDQVMNRLIQARIDESEEKVIASALKIQNKYTGLENKVVQAERREIQVCQHMWNIIKEKVISVEVPCAGFVRFMDYHNLRNHELFFNLMMAHAVIHQFQRKQVNTTADGIPIIEATEDDYKEAKLIFEALYSFGGQRFNTLKSEDTVVNTLLGMDLDGGYFTIKDLAQVSGLNDRECRRALNGRNYKGEVLGGLLSKCPCIVRVGNVSDHELEMVVSQQPNRETGKPSEYREIQSKKTWNQEVYRVDMEALERWKSKAGADPIWLENFVWGDVN